MLCTWTSLLLWKLLGVFVSVRRSHLDRCCDYCNHLVKPPSDRIVWVTHILKQVKAGLECRFDRDFDFGEYVFEAIRIEMVTSDHYWDLWFRSSVRLCASFAYRLWTLLGAVSHVDTPLVLLPELGADSAGVQDVCVQGVVVAGATVAVPVVDMFLLPQLEQILPFRSQYLEGMQDIQSLLHSLGAVGMYRNMSQLETLMRGVPQ